MKRKVMRSKGLETIFSQMFQKVHARWSSFWTQKYITDSISFQKTCHNRFQLWLSNLTQSQKLRTFWKSLCSMNHISNGSWTQKILLMKSFNYLMVTWEKYYSTYTNLQWKVTDTNIWAKVTKPNKNSNFKVRKKCHSFI